MLLGQAMLLDRQCCFGLLCPAAGRTCWRKEGKHFDEVDKAGGASWEYFWGLLGCLLGLHVAVQL